MIPHPSRSAAYLESGEAQRSLERDPNWPKWDSPWWHMTLLWEVGLASRIPGAIVRKMLQALTVHYLRFFPTAATGLPEGILKMNLLLIATLLLVPPLAIAGPVERDGIAVELPASLEGQRVEYERLITSSRDEVLAWFTKARLPMKATDLIDRAVVYQDTESARRAMAKVFGIDVQKIPDTFGGTVNGKTLYVTSAEGFHPSWTKLYPKWPWDRRHYRSLIIHELAHRAHAYLSFLRTGSEDAMGPAWFFEGLAVMCAGQFAGSEKPMNAVEILSYVGGSQMPKVSYPLYGRLVRSLALFVPVKTLVEKAAEPGFPRGLLQVVNKP